MASGRRPLWDRYGVAVASIGVAAAVRWLQSLWFHDAYPFAAFFLALLFTAWYGGFGPAILTSILAVFVAGWFVDSRPPSGHPLLGLALYIALSLAIAAVGGMLVAARRRIEEQIAALTRTQSELREAGQRKDEFLAVLAHELRNPLAPICNALEIMKLPHVEPGAAREARDVAERQLNHLTRLVDDLLDVSRIMGGKVELRKESLDLAVIVARALETADPLIERERHKLIVSLPDQPLVLEADLVRMAQVLANLLNNAAKYTEPGGQIELTAASEGTEIAIRVRDSGIGIAPDLLPHVFEMFIQAAPGSPRSQGGLGIGLTLVKNLVELHGGRIDVHSDGLGCGSEFCVRLPAMLDQTANANKPSSSMTSEASQQKRVLVVDDNVDAAQSLAVLLKLRGHAVEVAFGGIEALESARNLPPEIVFLDIGMPGMDGFEVARRLRADFTDRLLIVALTGWGAEQDRERSREAGFDRHLTKPVDLAALEDVFRFEGARREQKADAEGVPDAELQTATSG